MMNDGELMVEVVPSSQAPTLTPTLDGGVELAAWAVVHLRRSRSSEQQLGHWDPLVEVQALPSPLNIADKMIVRSTTDQLLGQRVERDDRDRPVTIALLWKLTPEELAALETLRGGKAAEFETRLR